MWSLEFVEVPVEATSANAKPLPANSTTDGASIEPCTTPNPARKALVPEESYSGKLVCIGLEDAFKFSDSISSKTVELGSSVDSDAGDGGGLKGWMERSSADDHWRRPVQSDRDAIYPRSPLCRNPDGSGETFSMDEELRCYSLASDGLDRGLVAAGVEALKVVGIPIEDAMDPGSQFGGACDPPTSDTSPLKDFCFITENDVKEARLGDQPGHPSMPKRRLRCGFRWQKQLVFRSKLTMHTAFERKDNKDPAAITALGISKYVPRYF